MSAKKKNAKKPRRIWHTVKRNGERVLIDPAGRVYHGTPGEVREAALMPYRRDALAQSLQLARYLREEGTFDAAEICAYCAACRREAIQFGSFDANHLCTVAISADKLIMLQAGSRLVRGEGETFDDFCADLFDAEISALMDAAECETGKREIPLTRHERRALAALAEKKGGAK